MRHHTLIAAIFAVLLPSAAICAEPRATATLAVLETTDLHSNVLSYDYFKLADDESFGLERTATLIARARKEFPNTILLDNGDTIQGTALADYQARIEPIGCDQRLAVYKVLDYVGADGGGIGNHEFNYGLDHLARATGRQLKVEGVKPHAARCVGAGFTQVLANVYSKKTRAPLFQPYAILDRRIRATGADGKPVTMKLKVGIIGFTPPTIMAWDKRHLEGRVYTAGLVETAKRYVPKMRAEGADIVIVISHGGLDASPYSPTMENGNWHLAKTFGTQIDAMLLGHSHEQFPNPASKAPQFKLPGVDKVKGTVHGVPTVMASLWGKHLGVIAMKLEHDGRKWKVNREATTVEARSATGVEPDPKVAAMVREEHEATIRYVKTPVGRSDYRMSTYFADVGDVSAVSVVNMAQADYVASYIKANLPSLAGLPVLSVSAPFKSGSAGATDYTDVPAGTLALNNAADLYLYPNSLYAVKVDGAGLKAWLEKAARRFNRIDPSNPAPQELVNRAFAGYNFDMLTSSDVRYEIDVTQPAGSRIRNLTWRGAALDPAPQFVVATNNYRASGGGGFPGLDGSKTVIASPDTNRDVLVAYIKRSGVIGKGALEGARSWSFAKVKTAGPVVFRSAKNVLGVAQQAGLANVSLLKEDDGSGKGYSLYAIDLSR